jgi:hypothetical protein
MTDTFVRLGETKAASNLRDIVAEMAAVLRAKEVDLGDERAVIRTLNAERFTSGEVMACMDDAVEKARVDSAPGLGARVGEALGAIVALGVWVAGYCLLCPPGSF